MRAGAQAEQTAARYLQRHGLRLLQSNYRCRFGEIDLILADRDTLVFVEVRLRTHSDFGGAAASIDERKQHKVILAAQHYLASVSPVPPCRFDAVLLTSADGAQGVEWLQNAFQL
jgi:putative endonuclease